MEFPPEGYMPAESALPNVEIYKPIPPEEEERPELVDFTCPNCNATTAYSIAAGGLECSNCGYYEPPEHTAVGKQAEEFEFKVEVIERAAHGWGEKRTDLTCSSCQAVTTLPHGSLTHTCPFCGSSAVVQTEAKQDALRPRFLIPFSVEEAELYPKVEAWLGSSWMLPGKLQNAAKMGLFNRIYLPFWTFDSRASAAWRAEVGYVETERYFDDGEWKTRTVTKWRWETGSVQRTFDDYLITGTTHVTQAILETIRDFDMSKLVPYEPKYLAGINAQAYEIALEQAWEAGRTAMREATRKACEQDALAGEADKVRNMTVTLDFSGESWRYVLLPVYLATYNYNDETYQIVVNGQTATIGGTRPVDWAKVIAVSAVLFVPAFLLGVIGLLLPPLLCVAGLAFMAAIAGVVALLSTAWSIIDPAREKKNMLEGMNVNDVFKQL